MILSTALVLLSTSSEHALLPIPGLETLLPIIALLWTIIVAPVDVIKAVMERFRAMRRHKLTQRASQQVVGLVSRRRKPAPVLHNQQHHYCRRDTT